MFDEVVPAPEGRGSLASNLPIRQGPCSSWDPRGKDQAAGRSPSVRAAATGWQKRRAWRARLVVCEVRLGAARGKRSTADVVSRILARRIACPSVKMSARASASGAGDDRKLYVRNGSAPYPMYQ